MSFKQFLLESSGFNPAEYITDVDSAHNFITFIGKDTPRIPEFKNIEDKRRLLTFIKDMKNILINNSPVEGKNVRGMVITYHFCQRILQREVDEADVLHIVKDYYTKNGAREYVMKNQEKEGVAKDGKK